MDLITKVKNTVNRHHLFSPGDKVIVAVSGGPDSITLLYILHELQYALGIHLYVAHLNHGLRKSARGDQQFVKTVASDLGLQFITKTIKVKKQKGSLEEIAREARLTFLIHLAKKYKANMIALGHTQDDLAETVLMRILRGTGLFGMRGIIIKRDFRGVMVVRPLLETTRKEIEIFIKGRKLRFCIDPTNKKKDFFRNKIRLELLPLLERKYNKNIKEVLANLAKTAAIDYECLESGREKAFKKSMQDHRKTNHFRVNLERLKKLSQAHQRLVIRLAIEKLKGDTRRLTLAHMNEIEDLINHRPQNSIVNLPKGILVVKEKGYLLHFTTRNP